MVARARRPRAPLRRRDARPPPSTRSTSASRSTSAAGRTTPATTSPAATASSTTSPWRSRRCGASASGERALVVDCDVHQGDGTAQIFADDDATFTLSLHGARNYPFSRVPSDLDVDIASGTGDARYLRALREALDFALDRARPDFAFYLAGADPWEGDRLGRLELSKAGLLARDELVLDRLAEAGAPACVVLAGGYAADISDTVDINAATVAAVAARTRVLAAS